MRQWGIIEGVMSANTTRFYQKVSDLAEIGELLDAKRE